MCIRDSSSIVSPLGGFLIGGLGSALADVAGGYAYYFIPTLLIKGLEGCMVAYLFQKYGNKIKWIAYFLGCMIMVIGYFFAKWYLKGSMTVSYTHLNRHRKDHLSGRLKYLFNTNMEETALCCMACYWHW